MIEQVKQTNIFQDGKTFRSIIQGLQQKAILKEKEDAPKIRNEARIYSTDSKMYEVPILIELQAGDKPQKVHFKKIKTPNDVLLSSSDGQAVAFSAETILTDTRNFLMEAGSKLKIKLMPSSQLNHIGSESYGTSYDECFDWQDKLRKNEAVVKSVHCANSNSLFVCEDERLFAIGYPRCLDKYGYD